jgi:hypothetical protein
MLFVGRRTLSHAFGNLTISEPSLCDPSVKQLSGYFNLKGGDKKYFFWFFGRDKSMFRLFHYDPKNYAE